MTRVQRIRAQQLELERQQKRIDELQCKVWELEQDRQKLRDWFEAKFKWFVSLMAENQSPSMPHMINEMVRLSNRLQPWPWSKP